MRLIDAEELERLFNEQIEQGVGVIGAFDAFYDALQDTARGIRIRMRFRRRIIVCKS